MGPSFAYWLEDLGSVSNPQSLFLEGTPRAKMRFNLTDNKKPFIIIDIGRHSIKEKIKNATIIIPMSEGLGQYGADVYQGYIDLNMRNSQVGQNARDRVEQNTIPIGLMVYGAVKTVKGLIKKISYKKAYKTLYEAKIKGTKRGSHRYYANKELYNILKNNPKLRNKLNKIVGEDVMAHMESGKGALKNPPFTEWHHPITNPLILELLETAVHRNPALQGLLHYLDNGGGGIKSNF
jgi:hypothetical protein